MDEGKFVERQRGPGREGGGRDRNEEYCWGSEIVLICFASIISGIAYHDGQREELYCDSNH